MALFLQSLGVIVRLASNRNGFEMTHIEAKLANMKANGLAENPLLGAGEGAGELSPEALALFSNLFAQIEVPTNVETDLHTPTGTATAETVPTGVTIPVDEITSLTQLLIAAQQIRDAGVQPEEVPSPIDNAIFSDAPMPNEVVAVDVLMQQAVTQLKQLGEARGTTPPKAGYGAPTSASNQLMAVLQSMIKSPADLPLSGNNPVLGNNPVSGDNPALGNDHISGLPLPLPTYGPNAAMLQGPPTSQGQRPVPVNLALLVQGPPDALGKGPIPVNLALLVQGPPTATGERPVPILAGASRDQFDLKPAVKAGANDMLAGVATGKHAKSTGGVSLDDAAFEPDFMQNKALQDKALGIGKKGGYVQTPNIADNLGANIAKNLASNGTQNLAQSLTQNLAQNSAQNLAQNLGVRVPTAPLPMPLDVGRVDNSTDAPSTTNNHAGGHSGSQSGQQQSGQFGGGQSGRDAQPMLDSGAKSAGGERMTAYRLNMQQTGWPDTMVRRLQTELANGTSTVKIILEPRNLGRLQVTMGLRNGRASIRIAADSEMAAGRLQDARGQLSKLFEQAGLRLASMQSVAPSSGSGDAGTNGAGFEMASDQQTSGQNANKDGKNSGHGNKLSLEEADRNAVADDNDAKASGTSDDMAHGLAPGEMAVLNVIA
ncbi:flagellar hook-length control protein FliK [Alphaproteobacteria bacterium]|nr:flagellar hook-length control protein FliK [Alphaproteobacteria bacterium]